jgi:hypothetical protein
MTWTESAWLKTQPNKKEREAVPWYDSNNFKTFNKFLIDHANLCTVLGSLIFRYTKTLLSIKLPYPVIRSRSQNTIIMYIFYHSDYCMNCVLVSLCMHTCMQITIWEYDQKDFKLYWRGRNEKTRINYHFFLLHWLLCWYIMPLFHNWNSFINMSRIYLKFTWHKNERALQHIMSYILSKIKYRAGISYLYFATSKNMKICI